MNFRNPVCCCIFDVPTENEHPGQDLRLQRMRQARLLRFEQQAGAAAAENAHPAQEVVGTTPITAENERPGQEVGTTSPQDRGSPSAPPLSPGQPTVESGTVQVRVF